MGTFVRYLIYIALIIAVYFIAKGLWDANTNQTVDEIVVGVSNTPENQPTAPAQKQ